MGLPDITVTGKGKQSFPFDDAYADLLRDESSNHSHLLPYKDDRGFWTIGMGHLIGNGSDKSLDIWRQANPPSGALTVSGEKALATHDMSLAMMDLDAHADWWRYMSPVRQRVIHNMCFNLGWTKLNKFGATLEVMRMGYWAQAAQHMEDSAWFGQVGDRAKRLCWMMRNDNCNFPKEIR